MKITIVGYGFIGSRHVRNIISLSGEGLLPFQRNNLTIVETSPIRRKKAEEDFGLSTLPSLTEALNNKQDVVLICTPSNLHIPLAQQAVEAGCNIFIEKPLSNSLEGISKLSATVQNNKVICLVSCNMWFHLGIKKLYELILSGELGEPRLFRSYWGHHVEQWHPGTDLRFHYSLNVNQGGGTLFDVGSHEFFFVPKLLGEIEYAKTDRGPSGFIATEVDDFSHTVVRLKNGVAGSFCFNFLDRCRRRSLEIVGEKATAVWSSEGKSPIRERFVIYSGNGPWKEVPLSSSVDIIHKETIKHFFNCIAGDEKPIQTLDSAKNVIETILSLREQGEYGRNIQTPFKKLEEKK